jgi:hypothetical protein
MPGLVGIGTPCINLYLHTIKRRKANWTGHIMRRNCGLKHVIAKKIDKKKG